MIHSKTKIIALVGMPGSGKSTAIDYLSQKGLPKVYFGGVVLKALEDTGLERNAENERFMREHLRQTEGPDAIAKHIVNQIERLIEAGQHHIVADGLYSWSEYKILKRRFKSDLKIIAILAPRQLRYHRLANRSNRPFTHEEAKQRDWSEIEQLEKGGPIAMADYFIVNDHSKEKLYADIDTELSNIGLHLD